MISIIGAGPAGLMAAHELASSGRKITVFEEHSTIGMHVQCTGIVTREIEKIIPLKKNLIVNRIKRVKAYASKGHFVELPVDDYVIDRAGFDSYLAERCEHEGIAIKRASRRTSIAGKGITIGADGPDSIVRKLINPKLKMQYYTAKQARINGDFDRDIYKVYLGSTAPGFFAWVVPEDESTARVGLATMRSPDVYFKRFIKSLDLDTGRTAEYQGGLIPLYNPNIKTQKKNLFIVGDAAAQVKATTGGGLVHGLKCAGILAGSIINNKSYEHEWRKAAGRELAMHLRLRKMLNRFSDRDYEQLIDMLKPEWIRAEFYNHCRDKSAGLCLSLLLKQPRLLKFAMAMFRKP